MFDVEAAFLNAELETPMYLEWPESMKELGFITEKEERKKCIKLVRSMYGNVDAALRWQKAFIKLCTNEEIKCVQSKTDPCMLYKKNKKGKICLMIAVYVDDVLMAGESEMIKNFKEQFKKTYKITDLGKLKRHLGVWYEWIKDNEESMVKIHMDDMAEKIVKEYERLTNGTVKKWNSPGYSRIKLTKPENEDEIYKQEEYRSMVGKVMYLVNKSNPTCLNAVRELAKHFNNPTKQH